VTSRSQERTSTPKHYSEELLHQMFSSSFSSETDSTAFSYNPSVASFSPSPPAAFQSDMYCGIASPSGGLVSYSNMQASARYHPVRASLPTVGRLHQATPRPHFMQPSSPNVSGRTSADSALLAVYHIPCPPRSMYPSNSRENVYTSNPNGYGQQQPQYDQYSLRQHVDPRQGVDSRFRLPDSLPPSSARHLRAQPDPGYGRNMPPPGYNPQGLLSRRNSVGGVTSAGLPMGSYRSLQTSSFSGPSIGSTNKLASSSIPSPGMLCVPSYELEHGYQPRYSSPESTSPSLLGGKSNYPQGLGIALYSSMEKSHSFDHSDSHSPNSYSHDLDAGSSEMTRASLHGGSADDPHQSAYSVRSLPSPSLPGLYGDHCVATSRLPIPPVQYQRNFEVDVRLEAEAELPSNDKSTDRSELVRASQSDYDLFAQFELERARQLVRSDAADFLAAPQQAQPPSDDRNSDFQETRMQTHGMSWSGIAVEIGPRCDLEMHALSGDQPSHGASTFAHTSSQHYNEQQQTHDVDLTLNHLALS
jgi:hypothetical protein